ncbi:MAG TPA: NAD-dependent succinate-semialdehyde dehydrogenase [Gemmatimonadaceae bacterium]|nr:NAD-dependent succinate-semialdehyde dehydrogenase [Gemmatimonadaceae bacterium]
MSEKLWIGGRWLDAAKTFEVRNPANGEVLAEVADATSADARRAVDAAEGAAANWASTPAPERAKLLRRAEALMLERADDLARTLTLEGGKPLAEARGEIGYAASFLGWFAGEAERVYGRVIPASTGTKRLLALRQPVGIVAAITPWNFPAAMVTRKIAPALAAGCTVVLKPAEQTPLTALRLASVFHDAGFPPGVFNVIPTSDPKGVGAELLSDPRVRKITFTGSTEVGKYLAREASASVKRVSLELGGHAPFIVFEDADLAAAARGAVASKFRNAGQTCVCANRFFVHSSVVVRFLAELLPLVTALKVGDGLKEGVHVGPLIDQAGLDKVERHVRQATASGARVLAGGAKPPGSGHGYFYTPTVLADVSDEMQVMREETFGPVAPVAAFETEDEVVRRANHGPFGLAAYLYTRDLSRAWRVAERLEYGIVGVNDPIPSTAQAPFGGFKESGLGREGGSEGMDAFLETKYVSMGI